MHPITQQVVRRVVAGALFALLCGPSLANTFGLHTVSWHDSHGPKDRPYERWTTGLYWRLTGGATMGMLHNSERRFGAYAGWTWSTDERRTLSASLTLGGITGYTHAPLLPLVVPSARWALGDNTAMRLILFPRIHPKQDATAVNLAFEWRR